MYIYIYVYYEEKERQQDAMADEADDRPPV